jgi:hypothetical protein
MRSLRSIVLIVVRASSIISKLNSEPSRTNRFDRRIHDDPEPLLNIDASSSLYTLTLRISLAPYYKTTKGLPLEP